MDLPYSTCNGSCLAAPSSPTEVPPFPLLPPALSAPPQPSDPGIYEPALHYEVSDLSLCQGRRFKTELYGRGKRFLPN